MKQGKFDEALNDLNKGLKIEPNYALGLRIRADIYSQARPINCCVN